MIFKEEMVGGRERVTTDEERDTARKLKRDKVAVSIKVLNKCWPRNSNYSSTQLLHKYFRLISRYLAMNISETVRDA